MEEKTQKPELSKQEKKEQKKILASLEEMQNISSEEFDRRIQLGIEKERKKLKWNNLNAGTKFNVILTAILILTAIVALFFQWKANSTTKKNLNLIQEEFEISYRPYISMDNTRYDVINDTIILWFQYKNYGKVPAIVNIVNEIQRSNSTENNTISTATTLFPGQVNALSSTMYNTVKDKPEKYKLYINYESMSSDSKYNTAYVYEIEHDMKRLKILNVTAE